jgi:hypothetical protein
MSTSKGTETRYKPHDERKNKMAVKFMWNGIKVDGELHKCWYSISTLVGFPAGTITIYGKNYRDLPLIEGLTVENDSDSMTDYFENDRIRVTPDNPFYPEVKAALDKLNEHNEKRFAKKYGKIA